MGFFDLFCIALTGGIALSGTARDRRWDEENRSEARKNGYLTYLDHRGARKLVSNDQLVTDVIGEPFKYELLDRGHHRTGRYIVDTGFKKHIEDKRRAEQEKEENRLRAYYFSETERLFNQACEWSSLYVEGKYTNAHKSWSKPEDAKYANYWMIPYRPYGAYKREAGRASWYVHTRIGEYVSHGFHIYDCENKKFVMLLKNFNRERAESFEPLKETLKYTIDDLEDGKNYLLDLTTEIVTFELGKYTVDAIAVCKKGSQVELPPDHVLIQKADPNYLRIHKDWLPSDRMDFMNPQVLRDANDWERERIESALKYEDYFAKKGQQYGNWDYTGIFVNNLVHR